jgi:uncharacterized protein YqjF (DUF2071 family)
MNVTPASAEDRLEQPARRFSDEGRQRLLSLPGEPLFLADWERALFIHYEVDAVLLQRELPFALDLWHGKAFVSLVAFTIRAMRPRLGGRVAAWLFKPISTHGFLNARTYVKHGDESGIYFITEWLSNRLSVALGPPLYGLPYRFAKLDYRHTHEQGRLFGKVEAPRQGQLVYEARLAFDTRCSPCQNDSLDEFLLERYTAYTSRRKTRRTFRVWHPSWPQMRVQVSVVDHSLLTEAWPWFQTAKFVGANYSPSLCDVWMGRSRFVK